MKSLAGTWDGTSPEGKMRVTYQVVSSGHAVLETMEKPDGSAHMITVYHRDGDALLATHYCAAGNQPRMRATPSAGDNKIAFRFLDITNLSGPDAGHIRDLTITFVDPTHITQEWASRAKGNDSTGVFHLVRQK